MKIQIAKNKAIRLFGSRVALAKALGISKEAVYQWPEDKPIPQARALQIRYILKPEAFQ